MNSNTKCLGLLEMLNFLKEIYQKIYKKNINKVILPSTENCGIKWKYYEIDNEPYHHRVELKNDMPNESKIKLIDFSDYDCLSYGFDNPFLDFYLTKTYQSIMAKKYGNQYDLIMDEGNRQL